MQFVTPHRSPPKPYQGCPMASSPRSLFSSLCRFVSDYAFDGFKSICQHKLIRALANTQYGTDSSRAYPPTLLEWTASRDRVNMALDIFCFNGERAE